jgi:outer membrane protein OmpA-like peptidoglycan-associated protein
MTSALLVALLAFLDFGGSGTSVLPLLQVGQGVRAAALGEAGIGLADDASALYWNPAGLGRVSRYHFTLSHHEWFGNIRDEVVHAAFPGRAGAFGIGLLYSAEPGIEYWSRTNTPHDTFSTWSSVLTLGYGATFARRWRLGAAVKGLYNSLHTVAGYGGAVDVGLGLRPLAGLELGLVGRNLGLASYGGTWRDLPTEAALGTAWTSGQLSFGADLAVPIGGAVNLRTGVEYRPARTLALRLGYRTGPVDLAGLGWHAGLSGGLGLALGPVQLDYAVSPHGALGLVHRIGLDFNFARRGSGEVLIRTVSGVGLQPLRANLAFDGVHAGTAATDRLGRHELSGLLPGRLIIRTSLPGHVPRVDTMHILGDRRQFATIDLKPADYGSIWVAIYDAATMQAIGGTVSYSGPIYGEQEVPANPGSAVIRNVPVGRYHVLAAGPGRTYHPASCTLVIEPGAVVEQRLLLQRGAADRRSPAAAPAATAPAPVTSRFEDITFGVGSHALPPEAPALLDRLAELLAAHPTFVVEIGGHTDDREPLPDDIETRIDLARARAESVRRYLAARGVTDTRLVGRGYADALPVADNDTDAGRARNRRVEFHLLED